jgi:hypothetical protein
MDAAWRASLWGQCGAAIDMLDDALRGCPDALWQVRVWDAPFAVFWNLAHPAGQLDDLVWQDLCAVLVHPEQVIEALTRAAQGQWLPQDLHARREHLRRASGS